MSNAPKLDKERIERIGSQKAKELKSKRTRTALKAMKSDKAYSLDDLFSVPGYEDSTKTITMKDGGLAEATAKLKAKGMKDGGMVVKEKVVAIDTSPNSGLITVKGFGAGRRT